MKFLLKNEEMKKYFQKYPLNFSIFPQKSQIWMKAILMNSEQAYELFEFKSNGYILSRSSNLPPLDLTSKQLV